MNSGLLAGLASGPRRAPLLYAPARKPLTADQCASQVERTVLALRERGIAPEDRVASVLPNGPESAMGFLAISSAATFAPLNPQYSRAEFVFFLQDLDARVLITEPGFCPAAVQAAAVAGVPVIGLRTQTEHAAGEFVLEGPAVSAPVPVSRRVDRDSIALLLHSSGTTARPKLIPLTHANLCASAANVARTLALDENDVCLNVMPLFHIHGLVGAFLSSAASGAAIACSSGFDAFRFAGWMQEAGATWCTAVPTMYQALLSRAQRMPRAERRQFRLLRSSSAHLHAKVWEQLEDVFGCPVLNSYGMTEASHQMASNPLPPAQRKIGTVGPAAGAEIGILQDDGSLAGPGHRGEVVIRGATVTRGYLSPESANAEAFRDGWLRTGDQGALDEDGYLTLIGRLKEIINIGGEKVAPAEVDDVLLQHPAVAQALAFGVPCRTLGERVCAAVVLQSEASESELRRFARERLARFKVPDKILAVDAIPKGPTGKLQRRGMAEKLGLAEQE